MNSNKANSRCGFSLLELTITLVVGAILMLGMLPLIRLATQQGAIAQIQTRDMLELQSLVERLSAWGAEQELSAMKSALGSSGEKSGIDSLGSFYMHSADYIYFDDSNIAQASGSATNLLEVRVGLTQDGPSLSKVFGE